MQLSRTCRPLLIIVGAAAFGIGVAPLPAAAQTPVPVTVDFDLPDPITGGIGNPSTGVIDIAFGDDFTPGVHELTATVNVDIGVYELAFRDLDGVCEPDSDQTRLVCTVPEAGASERIDFEYEAEPHALSGVYDVTLTIAVDGEAVDSLTDTLQIDGEHPGPLFPYLHGDVEHSGVAPGSTVEVAPEFLQEDPLGDDAAAVIVTVTDPERLPNGTEALAAYDNCMDGSWGGHAGITCVVTDFEDLPGTVFTFATPVAYAIDADAPGPIEACGCSYVVRTVESDALEGEFGGVTWDEDSDDLFGLRAVSRPGSGFDAEKGSITIRTAENPFDLAVEDLNIKGGKGDRVELVTTVANEGPASAYEFFEGPGSYALLGDLPEGVELYALWSDTGNVGELFCVDEEHWLEFLPEVDAGELDFACFFPELSAGESFDVEFNVDITDPDTTDVGRLEVVAREDESGRYPGVADADPQNDAAAITVNGNGSGGLPDTGASLTSVFGGAALVLVTGAALLAVATRRRERIGEV